MNIFILFLIRDNKDGVIPPPIKEREIELSENDLKKGMSLIIFILIGGCKRGDLLLRGKG